MAGRFFLGVDGGGTRTRARVVDDGGRRLGEGEAGAGNARLGDAGYNEVMEACRAALAAAGLAPSAYGTVHAAFGLAGTQQEADRRSVLDRPHPFASLVVETDAYAAWLGAFGGGDGAVLILGTGSAGLAVIGGARHVVGGWGADVADEGSGMAIGRLAIRKALWAFDGMAPMTPLAREILTDFDHDPPRVVVWAAAARPGDYAAFAPRVFDFAERGDELAIGVVMAAATDAAMLVRRLVALGAPRVAMVGGVFPRLCRWLPDDVKPHLIQPAGDGLDGAILMARRSVEGRAGA
jgi:glucosamine kinase